MENKKQEILKLCPGFPFNALTNSELENLRLDNDLIKGFMHNKRVYLEFKSLIKPKDDVVFFNICHLLGMFNKNGAELKYIGTLIMCLYANYSSDDIYQLGTQIENIRYIEKVADALINGISIGNLQGHMDMFIEYSNNYKRYSKDILKINNNRKNTINIRGAIYPGDQEELKRIKSTGKAVTMEDIIDYVSKKIQDKCTYKLLRYRPFGVKEQFLEVLGTDIFSLEDAQKLQELAIKNGAIHTKTI